MDLDTVVLVAIVVSFFVFMAIEALIPAKRAMPEVSHWGLWAAIPTIVLTTFFTYWSHRLQHRFDVLWRLGHQFHHGVARVDIASAFIFHPVDVFVQVFWTVLAA